MSLMSLNIPSKQKNADQTGGDPSAGCGQPLVSPLTLAQVRPGCQACVVCFSGCIQPDRRARLQAYGVIPGRLVRVLQRSPVMIIQVEHTELALENELAGAIQVEEA